ncbi:esterase/lipase family protein [Hydrogenophaga sp. PBL-H3]|uniref:esterase/lipase family protein n=1 Tax=Hydrogenophaga sp. PBL-H3 TaxID=434010 RepID=UPI00131F8608|nr:alpha/beta fold hydrolase [Hydrogenophaga sp. PBL-H3]QHE77924.1 alpha/beta fold hydrolase [Hydrogenophaga sp. PBL-H3]QHE82348.1 alpha/beta fold hydrolase [Hydrogenophaga sp. PBL-H3]
MEPLNTPNLLVRTHESPSTLARLQQAIVLGALAAASLWLWAMGPRSAVWAVAGVVFVFLGYAAVLAIEMVAAAVVNRGDASTRAQVSQWIAAWWQEVRVAPQVFGWRQPFCWRHMPDTVAASDTSRPAVVLIHGFVCNRGFWLPWMRRLRELQVPYVSVNLEPIFGSIDEYVPLVDAAVNRATALTGRAPTLICHSMGGLAARAWLASAADASARIDKVITIGSPHRGTWLARFSHLNNGRQMRHDGDWQQALLARELLLHPQRNTGRFVCWYSNTDNIVFPASTATLPGADNRLVPGAAHVALAFHPRVMNESLAMVASAPSSPSERTVS